jgi:peptidoglycan hydrolase-like protein with peptidoglycan-binding domain
MAFVTTFVGKLSGKGSNAYNIDFSVGPGVRGNQPVDIMLVQALLRIVHFEVKTPLRRPPGENKVIEVDGKLGPVTVRYLINAQRVAKESGQRVRLDGIFDPFRAQGEFSHIAKVRYVLEMVNDTGFALCRDEGINNYEALPSRDDIPTALQGALNAGRRDVARQYENEQQG